MSELNPGIEALLKDASTLIPAVVQDASSKQVLMLAYMNTQSLALTLSTKKATYWSRSRNELWVKGATSGHFQEVQSVALDCDGDSLLVTVNQIGTACHTGNQSCFHQPLEFSQ